MSEQNKISLGKRWEQWVWGRDLADLHPFQAAVMAQLRTAALVSRDFLADRCLLRASALTYASMLAIVPLLALTFSLLKAFGVQNLLEPIILKNLSVGSEEVVASIIGYINNTQVGRLGALGLALLLVAVVSLLSNVEKSFNYVWGVDSTRSLMRRFSDYLSVVLVGPVLLISAMSMTTSLTSHDLVQKLLNMDVVGTLVLTLFKVFPYLFMWLAFAVLYVFMSNTRVEWKPALIGGMFGGTLWQVAQWGYVNFQVGVAKYNAIYGTMAALPIFMVWLYLSWAIVLLGLEIVYARQNLRVSGYDLRQGEVSTRAQEQVSLAILVVLAERFSRGETPLSQAELARLLAIPPRLCGGLLDRLHQLGLVAENCQHGSARCYYQLGRAAEHLKVTEILTQIRCLGAALPLNRELPSFKAALSAFAAADDCEGEALSDMTLAGLCGPGTDRGGVTR
ncbi:MAG: ribonuclease BN-like protein [Desulfuromonas sp.]|nr:MAG: ribonuclease BN-like protein [Desulfuromonas sp.]